MNPYPLATFLSYSHANKKQLKKLREHFVQLERERLIRIWDDRELRLGQDFNLAIGERLEQTEVFILLVSPEFLASEYCSSIEMKRALERHEEGTALILSIIIAPCDWMNSPLAKLQVAPTGGKPISYWSPRDAGWTDATTLSRRAIVSFRERLFSRPQVPVPAVPPTPVPRVAEPRPVPQLPPDPSAGKTQEEMPAVPAPSPQRVEKTELVPLYVTLPGFQVPKVATGEDQEETARLTLESISPHPAGSAEKTDALDLPPPSLQPPVEVTDRLVPPQPMVEPTARLVEPPPSLAEPVARLNGTAPPPEDAFSGPWKTRRQSRIAVGMAVVSAVLLMIAAAAFMCSSRSAPQPKGEVSLGTLRVSAGGAPRGDDR